MPRKKFKGYRNRNKVFFEDPLGTPGWTNLTIEDDLSNEQVLKEFNKLYGGTKITISRLHKTDKIMYHAMKKRGLLRKVHELR